MAEVKIIDVNKSINADNDEIAAVTRRSLKEQGTFMVNLMASPGAGKTSLLLQTVKRLGGNHRIGVMEADIEAAIDAERMQEAGIRSIEVHTGGECAMDAEMTRAALDEFKTDDLDILFLENVGNLVCPAETDTGAARNAAILSVPEGDDKPLKYPLMFEVCQAVVINKIDTLQYFAFDFDKAKKRIHERNPHARVFLVSAKTGEGIDGWVRWLEEEAAEWKK